ncbi:MAG TPA: response regulator [Patescibacteria group bacterium]|nr:response regulator [Patescibacteria group bacterium]
MIEEKRRILVADDAQENLSLLNQLLGREYNVKTAGGGEEALLLAGGEPAPDLIMLDIVMPDIDGYEVCRRLKSNPQTASIPVIFLTVRTDSTDEELGLRLGAVDYITKPFSPAIVLARVQTHLELKVAADVLRKKNSFLEQEVLRRQAVEQALLRANRQLECTNQELRSFDYSVSHDLKAPVRHILGFGKILKEDHAAELGAQGFDYLERILGAAERMENMLKGLLDLSRLSQSPLNLESVDLSAMAVSILEELRQSEPERVLDSRIRPGITVYGDSRMLSIMMSNLLGNAWKFTRDREPARIELDMAAEEGQATYVVRDNGAGFDMESSGKLFAPFQRLHSVTDFPGTGIGLATVARIVHRHGGEVWGESVPDQGAEFFFTLTAEKDDFLLGNGVLINGGREEQRHTVLVIDDAPEILTLLGQLLKNDYLVKVANNGNKGLRIAQSEPQPDLILLDVLMPGMDGYEVCRRLKSEPQTRDIPIIFLTGKSEMHDEETGLKMGAADYITKPVSPAIVLARIKVHLQLKLMADCLREENMFLESEMVKRTADFPEKNDNAGIDHSQ